MKSSNSVPRIHFIFVVFIVLSLIIFSRLYFVQVIDGGRYLEMSERQYVNRVSGIFDRGNIYFKDKKGLLVSAASVKTGFILAINPSKIIDSDKLYSDLISIIPDIDKTSFLQKAGKEGDPYEEILHRVDENTAEKIIEKKLIGVSLEREKWRIYPGNKLGANVIGFVGYNEDKIEGRYGLEKYYEDVLGRSTDRLYVNVFAELFSNISNNFIKDKNREGDIITSIDPEVQSFLERALEKTRDKWSSKVVGGIVIDPMTGKIYAMASTPSFDPNNFSAENDLSVFANPSVSSSFEMGSVVKAITMTIGIDSGAVTAKTTFDDKGYISLDGKKITNVDKKPRGISTMQDILSHSMNTGATFVMQKVGKDKFAEYMNRFGLGIETGIDLPSEAGGNMENLKSPRDLEYATASFGQGISMTPINITRALSAIANGGKLINPSVVEKINYKVGLSKNISYVDEGIQIVSKEATEDVTRMLVKLFDEALIQGKYKQEHYSIAAKTGTAQIARPAKEGGGYYDSRFLHTLFGYFPAYSPRFLVFLYNLDPKDVDFASQTLSDPFSDISKFLINYYEIPPDR